MARKSTPACYEVRSDRRAFERYEDRAWALHSAECFASFYGAAVYVIDVLTGEVIATKLPSLTH